MTFLELLTKIRNEAYNERDKGAMFEQIIKGFLLSDPRYAPQMKEVWLWNEFPARDDFGGKDTGIDIVAQTINGEYWAVQCKCFAEKTVISKGDVDTFLSTSGKLFTSPYDGSRVEFVNRLWVATTDNFSSNALEVMTGQKIPVSILGMNELENSIVDWSLLEEGHKGFTARKEKYSLRPHQKDAADNALEYFKHRDRGQLIMACGTGKTFTSLRIAEQEAQSNGVVLVLVPSIALINQILGEWTAHAVEDMYAICVCSDPKVSKKTMSDDIGQGSIRDLALPATTNPAQIVKQFELYQGKRDEKNNLIVVFSTYQSIDVIESAQKAGFPEFDIIICDEAHRTTGVELKGIERSAFIKVHDKDAIHGKKRLYMTATPRIYSPESKAKAKKDEAELSSMDDPEVYGEEIYRIGFGEAVEKELLTDYKVLVFTVRDTEIPPEFQKAIALVNEGTEIPADTAAKLIGCINALSKNVYGLGADDLQAIDPGSMKRAVAFCNTISASKQITTLFNETSDNYILSLSPEQRSRLQSVSSQHIDGTMNALQREEKLNWLKSDSGESCRLLSNVRCLSEGVDVPALDAILFLSARNSQIDVVQSVGRVMRRSEGKKYGYIIIPVLIPSDVSPEDALDNNERYKVIWSVLNALRAHDDRFNAMINKIELNKKKPGQVLIGGMYRDEGEDPEDDGKGSGNTQIALPYPDFDGLQNVIYARLVQKVGSRRYWEDWAKSVADIAMRQIDRITKLVSEGTASEQFDEFLKEMQISIDKNITKESAIEMLAQHTITAPVFDALFEDYAFAKKNAISVAMDLMLEVLTQDDNSKADMEELSKFYSSVKSRAEGIDNAEGKQKIILELYNSFFEKAFPKMAEQLGLVYTPVEVVDFIIHSVNDVLNAEFGRGLTDENVNILDPFTGTGTFITRLMQTGVISKEDLPRKFRQEIFANEIVLLAYYIASVNIENVYHDEMGLEEYEPFQGIALTDTFQTAPETENETMMMFDQNSERVGRLNSTPITVIMSNPPYSVGQKSANDDAANRAYPGLDERIRGTYVELSNAVNRNALYDSYIRAFRYATDRLGDRDGIICFVSNGSWLDGDSTAGFRKSLEQEFSQIYVLNLRGNARTSGELNRKEGGLIFSVGGKGSKAPIAITLLVKRAGYQGKAEIFYRDIGDYLSRDEKLKAITDSVSFLREDMKLVKIAPNEHGDWITERKEAFGVFLSLASSKKFNLETESVFITHSRGFATAKDAWLYNYSKESLSIQVSDMIEYYHAQISEVEPNYDSTKISWSRGLLEDRQKGRTIRFERTKIGTAMYRPFQKQNFYYGEKLMDQRYLNDRIFPTSETKNLVISVSSIGDKQDFSCLISNTFTDLHFVATTQCFPLYYYEEQSEISLLSEGNSAYKQRDGVSDYILKLARTQYGYAVSKEDIFFYVYGLLHSEDYRTAFSADLKKSLPRIPLVEKADDFWAFSQSGRELAELHINYEHVEALSEVTVLGDRSRCHVSKLRFLAKDIKDTIIFNEHIRVENIPAAAYEYIINGRTAIEWVMDRYQVTTDKASGIVNDPNLYAEETGQPEYILNLLLSVIAVSVKTMEIVKGLPKLEFSDAVVK